MDALLSMGFKREECERALRVCSCNVERSLEYLLSRSKGDGDGDDGGDKDVWVCEVCTFENPNSVPTCTMCGATPGDDSPPPRHSSHVAPSYGLGTIGFAPAADYGSDGTTSEDEDEDGDEDEDDERGSFAEVPPKRKAMEAAQEATDEQSDDRAPEEFRGDYARLRAFFLSSAASTEKKAAGSGAAAAKQKQMCDSEIVAMLRQAVPNVGKMLDRRKSTPVTDMIVSTYHRGLPLFDGQPSVQRHVVASMHEIFSALSGQTDAVKRRHLTRLADAFTSCQAEQVRVIDAVYGAISGRDRGLREQVLAVVDEQKQRVLDRVTHVLHPDAWHMTDATPTEQVPHIQSGYRAALGKDLGLRASEAAKADYCAAKSMPPDEKKRVTELFRRLFSVDELVDTLVGDVNQQDPNADRLVTREALMQWAGDAASNKGFEAHSIFYDEERVKDYGDGDGSTKPTEANAFQPFLSKKVALGILVHLFL